MPAVLVDVGYHLVEPDTSGQTVSLSVVSTTASDATVAGFNLKAQIVTAKYGPNFQGVRFAGDLWNTFPHVESGGPLPVNRTLALGDVAFTQGFEARADGKLVTFTIDTTGIPAGSYEFRLVATQLGNSSFRSKDGSSVSAIIKNGTLQVRSIWQNPDDPNDINDDGRISPLDVLLLLNELSKEGTRELEMPSPGDAPFPYFDVNGDGHMSPKDALNIINCLNGLGCVTSPAPILAQVTPDLQPIGPGSTGVGAPSPAISEPKAEPRDNEDPQTSEDPKTSEECVTYQVDEHGHPVPVIVPVSCEEFAGVPAPVIPESPIEMADVTPPPAPVSAERIELADELFPAKWALGNGTFVAVASPPSVDAAIVDLVDERSRESTSDELVELSLGELFAVL